MSYIVQDHWDEEERVKQAKWNPSTRSSYANHSVPSWMENCLQTNFTEIQVSWMWLAGWTLKNVCEKDCLDSKSRRCIKNKLKGVKDESVNQTQTLTTTQALSWWLFQIDWSFCCHQQKRPTEYDRHFVFICFTWSSSRASQTHQQNIQELF